MIILNKTFDQNTDDVLNTGMADDPELGVINSVLNALESLPDAEARIRVLAYVISRLRILDAVEKV